MVSNIIHTINDVLGGFHPEEQILGIAQRIIRNKADNQIEYFPGIIDEKGEVKPVVVDDRYSITIYHRLINCGTTRVARTGVGDKPGYLQNVYTINFFAYWSRKKLPYTEDQMQMMLMSRIPGAINPNQQTGIRSIGIGWGSTSFGSQQVYASEYNSQRYPIPEHFSLLMMGYTVTIIFDPDCYKSCP